MKSATEVLGQLMSSGEVTDIVVKLINVEGEDTVVAGLKTALESKKEVEANAKLESILKAALMPVVV